MRKYEVPKILLVDIDENTTEKLINAGFNIDSGTFGSKYKDREGAECGLNHSLPYLTEKNIIIVDMNEDKMSDGINPLKKKPNSGDRESLIMPRGSIEFNPRYLSGVIYQNSIRNVLNNNGILIVFADKPKEEIYYPVRYENGLIYHKNVIKVSNYNWLPNYDSYSPTDCVSGKEIYFNNETEETFGPIFSGCEDEITYHCIFWVGGSTSIRRLI